MEFDNVIQKECSNNCTPIVCHIADTNINVTKLLDLLGQYNKKIEVIRHG